MANFTPMILPLALLVVGAFSSSQARIAPIVVNGELCHPRNLLVKYRSDADLGSLGSSGMRVLRKMPEIHYAVVETPAGTLQASRRYASACPGIERADLDRAARPAYDPNDPIYPNMWNLQAIHANLAWDTTKGSPDVIVAVLDTGCEITHPDLADSIWTNPGEVDGNGLDDDGNGYVDDVHGYDFAYGNNDLTDNFGHGTSCSGIIGATQDNNIGITGIAPHTKLMVLKTAIDSGFFFDSATVPAYLYAANNGAKVLSMSYFSDRVSQAEHDALIYCVNHGVLPVAAAGNSSSVYPYYPGGYEEVLCTAAVNPDLSMAGFSNHGSWVDVSAPGVSFNTVKIGASYTTGFAGTSAACPHVAGVAALLFAANPAATPEQVRDAIEDSATLQSQAPFGEFSNYGFIDANLAVATILGAVPPAKPPVVRYVNAMVGALVTRSEPKRVGRIYGRGFAPPANVVITQAGVSSRIIARSRDWIDYAIDPHSATMQVTVDGNLVATVPPPNEAGYCYPLAEASTVGATLTGGFFETLRNDGNVMTCTRRSDGLILIEGTFRRVQAMPTMHLTLRRKYTGTTVGTETVALYDWSSASYPYGNFVTLGSGPVPGTMTTSFYTVPNAGRFLDDEHTVYFRITTSSDLDPSAVLNLDEVLLSP